MRDKPRAYQHHMEYYESTPKIGNKIDTLSSISRGKYFPGNEKSTSREDLLNRPDVYSFNVVTRGSRESGASVSSYYYHDKDTAIREHNGLCVKLYDQRMEKSLRRIKARRRMRSSDKDYILNTFDEIKAIQRVD